jgi:hypothetical protein
MRAITAVTLLLSMLLAPGVVYALSGQSEQPVMAPGSSVPVILCLNHKVSGPFADVMISPVYDWVHGGQQGISFTITNKTNESVVIDWDKTLYVGRSANEVPGDFKTSSLEESERGLYDVVAPGATFSKTLWPSSSAQNAWRLENRSLYLSAKGDKGLHHYEEILLNISGDQRRCTI